jgi:hypothetical protein
MRKTTIVENKTEVVEKVTAFTLEKHIIMHTGEDNGVRFVELINRLKCVSPWGGIKDQKESHYIHGTHLDMLEEAVKLVEDKYRHKGE